MADEENAKVKDEKKNLNNEDKEKFEVETDYRTGNICGRLIRYSRHLLERCFYNIGYSTAKRPVLSIILTWFITGCFVFGFFATVTETEPIQIWVDPNSDFVTQKDFFDDNFGPFYRIEQFLILPRDDPNADILQGRYLSEMYQLEEQLRAIVITESHETYYLSDFCSHVYANSPCIIETVLDYFQGYNASSLASLDSATIHEIVSRGGRTPFGEPLGKTPYPDVCIGGIERNADGDISYAVSLMTTYPMNASDSLNDAILDWELQFLSIVNAFNDSSSVVYVFAEAERSINDILAAKVNADIYLVVLNYVILVVYVALNIGQFDLIRTKVGLGLAGVCCVGLATASGLGLGSIFGIPFSPITGQVIPFLVLGLAISDQFVITDAYIDNYDITDLCERLGKTYSYIAASALLTCLTNSCALLVGALSNMPAVKWFCYQGAICLILAFIINIFTFGGLLTLDAMREKKRRSEFFCMKIERERTRCLKTKMNLFAIFLQNYMLPFILKPICRAIILIIFFGVFGISVWGALNTSKGLGIDEVVPSDSYVVPFVDYENEYFLLSAPVYCVMEDFDYTNYTNQDAISALQIDIAESPWTSEGLPISWWSDFVDWLECGSACGCAFTDDYNSNGQKIPPDQFYPWLYAFLANPTVGQFYTYDVVFKDDGTIKASRFLTYSVPLITTNDYIDAIEDQKDSLTSTEPITSFAYSVFYIYFEQYISISTNAYEGILVAMAVVGVMSFLFLVHPVGTPVSMVVVGLISTDLLGVMYIWDIDLNPLSVVNLITSVGFGVCFSIYFTRAYLVSTKPTPKERTIFAMVAHGTSVLNGALATFLGILVLAFASYEVFRVYFFRMYFAMILIGIFHAYLFVPVYLTTVGEFQEFVLRKCCHKKE